MTGYAAQADRGFLTDAFWSRERQLNSRVMIWGRWTKLVWLLKYKDETLGIEGDGSKALRESEKDCF